MGGVLHLLSTACTSPLRAGRISRRYGLRCRPPAPTIGFVDDAVALELLAAVHEDLASDTNRMVLADRLLLEAGFAPERLAGALARYHRMRTEMAAGAYLAITGAEADARRLAFLKGGSYTVEGPLLIGAALAGASVQVVTRLERYGEPLGEAFQLLDDLRDGDASAGVSDDDARKLIAEAKDALDPEVLVPDAVTALAHLADLVAAAGGA